MNTYIEEGKEGIFKGQFVKHGVQRSNLQHIFTLPLSVEQLK